MKSVLKSVLSDRSLSSAVAGTRMRPSQKTGDDSSMNDMPAMLAASGRFGQKWLQRPR